jgi:hypothetical protein
MPKEFQEPEEKDMDENFAQAEDNFNPLDEAIIEKAYTRPNVRFNDKDMLGDIPEPSFVPPPMGTSSSDEERIKKPIEPLNKELNDLPKKDKHDAADKVAKMILGGYRMGNEFIDKKLLFDKKKISKLQMSGELDLSVQIPISENEQITAGEFIEEFNQQSEGTITVSKEFEEEVLPILTRVLEKRGVGMTDEQYLVYLFGKDLAVKGFMVTQSLSAKKEMLEVLKEATLAMRENRSTVKTAPRQEESFTTETYTPEKQESTVSYANVAPSVNDIVNEMTGANQVFSEMETQDEANKEEDTKAEKVGEIKILDKDNKVIGGKRGRPKKQK